MPGNLLEAKDVPAVDEVGTGEGVWAATCPDADPPSELRDRLVDATPGEAGSAPAVPLDHPRRDAFSRLAGEEQIRRLT